MPSRGKIHELKDSPQFGIDCHVPLAVSCT